MQNKKYKASVLAVTLIIMAIILASALSISAVSVRERKGSIGANRTSLAYQTADMGAEMVFSVLPSIIKNDLSFPADVSSIDWSTEIGGCDCETSGADAGWVACGEYKFQLVEITDHATGASDAIDCDDSGKMISAIDRVKFVGTDPGGQTQRAVEADVPVAP